MRTRRTRARSSRRRRFRGARRSRTKTWADITSSGRAIWCSRRRRFWPADASIRRGERWCIWPARSTRTAASRRTSGSTNAVLDGHSAGRGGVPDHPRVAAVEGGRARQLRRLSVRRAGCGVPRALRADHPAGALGGERGLLAVDSGGGHQRPHLRGGYRAGTCLDGAGELSGVLRRLARSASGRVDDHRRRRSAAGGQAALHARPSTGRRRAVPQPNRARGYDPHRQSRAGRAVQLRGARGSRRWLPGVGPATAYAAPTIR